MNPEGEIPSRLNGGIFLKTLIWLDSLQHESPYRLPSKVEAEYRRTVFASSSLSDAQKGAAKKEAAPSCLQNSLGLSANGLRTLATVIPLLIHGANNLSVGHNGNNIPSLSQSVIQLNSMICSCLIELSQRNLRFSFLDRYDPSREVCNLLRTMRKEYSLVEHIPAKIRGRDTFIDLWELAIINDEEAIRQHYEYLKLLSVLLCLGSSPTCDASTRRLANDLLFTLTNTLADCRINRIVFESNTHCEKENTPKSTTMVEIFFFLPNGDRYCLRIDSPHDGAQYYHFNLHEPGGDTACPLSNDERNSLCSVVGQSLSDRLLYRCEGSWWFRSHFETILEEAQAQSGSDLSKVRESFESHRHRKIFSCAADAGSARTFFAALSEGMATMNADGFEYGRTKHVEIESELFKMSQDQSLRELVVDVYSIVAQHLDEKSDFECVARQISRHLSESIRERNLSAEAQNKVELLLAALPS